MRTVRCLASLAPHIVGGWLSVRKWPGWPRCAAGVALGVLGVSLWPISLEAQTPVPSPIPANTKLCWDHDGVNLDRFELTVDGGTATNVGKPTPAGVMYCTPFPALTPGTHVLVVSACNIAGCAASAPFPVSVVVQPAAPNSLRIVTQ